MPQQQVAVRRGQHEEHGLSPRQAVRGEHPERLNENGVVCIELRDVLPREPLGKNPDRLSAHRDLLLRTDPPSPARCAAVYEDWYSVSTSLTPMHVGVVPVSVESTGCIQWSLQ